jgi:hypothetical protein
MKPLLPVLALLLVLPVQAEVYRIVGPDGSVTFTDQPTLGAEKINLPPVSTYPAQKLPAPAATPAAGNDDTASSYASFTVAAPAPETTIRDNQGNISMLVNLEPPLRAELGHRIQFLLDGVDQGEPQAVTGVTFHDVDRGSHTLSARIVDADGATLMTAPAVTVFLHRASILSPARQ